MGTAFRLEALPTVLEPHERCDHFVEPELAQAQYLAHRSANAPANTTTHRVVNANGEVAGFISFRIGREELDDRINVFFSVEYICVVQKFRTRGPGKQLLESLVQRVQEVLHQLADVGSRKRVHLMSASHPESLGGSHLLKDLETRVWTILRAYPDVVLVGWHIERPVAFSSTRQSRPGLTRAPGDRALAELHRMRPSQSGRGALVAISEYET